MASSVSEPASGNSSKDGRRHRRLPMIGPVRLAWESGGETKFALGKCVDISEGGMRIEVLVPIPLQTALMMSADRIQLSGAATVRHLVPRRAKYLVGLELCGSLYGKALAAIRAVSEQQR
jgi:hypothetical protein